MTTFNTGNAVPSADARDRFDNSQTFDEVVNGGLTYYTNRVGNNVLSLKGMTEFFNSAQAERDAAFQVFLDGTGWSSIGAYGAGVVITSHTQTVDYLGQPYSLKPSIPASLDAPYVTTGVWATEGINFKLVGDNSLRQDLAAPTGAGAIGVQRSVLARQIQRANDIFDSMSIDIMEAPFVMQITDKPNPSDMSTWDWSPAWQAALNYLIARAEAQGTPYGIPKIRSQGRTFRMMSGVSMKPWTIIEADGPVVFDFRQAPVGTNGFTCDNFTTIPMDALLFPGNSSPYLDGSSGSIAIWGPGKVESDGSAMVIGNFAAGGKPFRDASVRGVIATGWKDAQLFGKFDTYLFKTIDCRLQGIRNCVRTSSGTCTNSGERMRWQGCTFGGYDIALNHDIDTFDAYFDPSNSFDYGNDVIKFGSNSRYCSVFMTFPYVEALERLIVDATGVTGTADVNQITVTVTGLSALANNYVSNPAYNSPSRRLFDGRFSLILEDSKFRYQTRPYLENGAVIGPDVTVVKATGYHRSPQTGPLHLGAILNADYNFQKDADGTAGASLTAWELVAANSCATSLATVGGKKALRLVGSSGTNASNCTFRGKGKIPARMGDAIYVNATMHAPSATGSITIQEKVEYYDDADVSLGVFPTNSNYSFADALADTTLLNYAEGTARWMDTGGFRAVAPANTAYGKKRFTVTGFDGTVYVNNSRGWKM